MNTQRDMAKQPIFESWEDAADALEQEASMEKAPEPVKSTVELKSIEELMEMSKEERISYLSKLDAQNSQYVVQSTPAKEDDYSRVQRLIREFEFGEQAVTSAREAYSAYDKLYKFRIRKQRLAPPSSDEQSKQRKYMDALNVLVSQFCRSGIDIDTLIPSFDAWKRKKSKIKLSDGRVIHLEVETGRAGAGEDDVSTDFLDYSKAKLHIANDWKNKILLIIRKRFLDL
jgi:hypothetical protein